MRMWSRHARSVWTPARRALSTSVTAQWSETLREVNRLHHVRLSPITLNALIQRGPEPPLNSSNWNEVWMMKFISFVIIEFFMTK